jgi:hypothetical protein
MPFDLAELSVEELRSSDRVRDEAKWPGAVVPIREWQLPAFVSGKMERHTP